MLQSELTAAAVPTITAEEPDRVCRILEAVRALSPLLTAQRDDFDRGRRLPEAAFAALAEAGLFRLWLPQSLTHNVPH